MNTALLLIGPTGSGKTPLGDHLEAHGLQARRCHHFDFGAHLRRVHAGDWSPSQLSLDDLAVVRDVLTAGDLLADHQFHIARRILLSFVEERDTDTDDLIVLNGLPRHLGQARDMADLVAVQTLLHLRCTPEVALHRIRADAGGDRGGRTDDDLRSVRRKLTLFTQRTAPLIGFYSEAGARVIDVQIAERTTPQEIYPQIG